jgi:hypothetical protein
MQAWEILNDGEPYSMFYSNLRSPKHAGTIVRAWAEHQQALGYCTPDCSARPYLKTCLDNYGVKRAG